MSMASFNDDKTETSIWPGLLTLPDTITFINFGFIFDLFFKETALKIPEVLHHHNHGSGVDTLLGFIFILILIYAYVSRFKESKHVATGYDSQTNDSFIQKQIIVEGMTCGHCKESVESVVNAFDSVKQASVDLISGKVLIEGVDIAVSYTHLTLPTIYSV